MPVLSGFVCDCISEQDRPQMGLIAAVALITIILASMLCVLVLRQLTRTKKGQRSPEAMLSLEDVPPGYEYDVFLSFRGSDTRDNFTDCLYHRLRLAGVHVFRDNEELRVGEEIGGELLKALNKSQIYIPIFSQNYATSSWCLREVAHMVKCTSKSNGKKEILPIFYDVYPDDVKLKTKLYKKAILRHKRKFGSDALKRWEDALVQVADRKGWELKGKGHGELIELVVGEVLCKLNARNVDMPEYLVKDHHQIKAIIEKLDVDSDGVHFLGIHGIGGIGKTVLAKVVFNEVCSLFDGVCFLNNVRESLQHGHKSLQHRLIKLQKKLLASFGGLVIDDHIKDTGDGMNRIKKVCHTKKVLIVLDDLDKQEQLKRLAGNSDWFGSGSRIIFTTRNLEVLKTRVQSSGEEVPNQPKGILAYEVHGMELGHALKLFCKHTFGRDSPLEGYDHLAKEIVCRVGMLPLAIEVIGSHLYCQGSALEQHCDNQKIWEETLKQLDDGPFKDVRDALMISYEGLEIKQKEVFLDIACLFTNEDQTYPIIMWDDCNYHPYSAINVLRLRSLIKIGHDNKFWMHDQVRDLGRHIILQENSRKLSRVWTYQEAVELLERKKENVDVKALSLTYDGCSRNIVPEELAALPDLMFLRVKGIDFFGNFENVLSKLRWLSWEVMHNEVYAENFHFAGLVVLDLSRSNIEDDWGGWSKFQAKKLKVLDLTSCQGITKMPDLSGFLNLERLILCNCLKLGKMDSSFVKLKRLTYLNLKGCISLEGVPEGIGRLLKLEYWCLEQCSEITELPSEVGDLKSLLELNISDTGIQKLPVSVGKLKKLKVIRSKKDKLSLLSAEEPKRRRAQLPGGVDPNRKGRLSFLTTLKLSDSSDSCIHTIPSVIIELINLMTLDLKDCEKLQQLPKLPKSLEQLKLPRFLQSVLNIVDLINLFDLLFFDGSEDLSFHASNAMLTSLRWIRKLSKQENLESCLGDILASSIELNSLSWRNKLSLLRQGVQSFIWLSSFLSVLAFGDLYSANVRSYISSFKNSSNLWIYQYDHEEIELYELKGLRKLTLENCEPLQRVFNRSIWKNLKELRVIQCPKLVEFQNLGELKSLEKLHVKLCQSIERLSGLSNLGKLNILIIEECGALRDVEGLDELDSLSFMKIWNCSKLKRLTDVSNSKIPDVCEVIIWKCGRLRDFGHNGHGLPYKHYREAVLGTKAGIRGQI